MMKQQSSNIRKHRSIQQHLPSVQEVRRPVTPVAAINYNTYNNGWVGQQQPQQQQKHRIQSQQQGQRYNNNNNNQFQVQNLSTPMIGTQRKFVFNPTSVSSPLLPRPSDRDDRCISPINNKFETTTLTASGNWKSNAYYSNSNSKLFNTAGSASCIGASTTSGSSSPISAIESTATGGRSDLSRISTGNRSNDGSIFSSTTSTTTSSFSLDNNIIFNSKNNNNSIKINQNNIVNNQIQNINTTQNSINEISPVSTMDSLDLFSPKDLNSNINLNSNSPASVIFTPTTNKSVTDSMLFNFSSTTTPSNTSTSLNDICGQNMLTWSSNIWGSNGKGTPNSNTSSNNYNNLNSSTSIWSC